MTKIKFCGLTRADDAKHAEFLGADYGGVVFAESPRHVTADDARAIFEAAPGLKRVGVVSKQGTAALLRTARAADLQVLQLHGAFTMLDINELRQEFDGEIWAVLPVPSDSPALPNGWDELADVSDALVLDTSVGGVSGGTGRTFDWDVIASHTRELLADIRIVVAGGLNPGNVAAAIPLLRPAIVDVSSGVEASPGKKDPFLMNAFARAVRSASIV
jgi:phosphoribosylanthranilate isomerase